MSELVLREMKRMDDFLAAEELQRTVWGEGDQPDPADLMMVIHHEGGLVGGAYAGEQLVGYVFGFPTRDPKVQHSHRLAVHPDMRGKGLALRLKWFQREWCLAQGIEQVRWTFDPQRHTNAHLNIGRLGAVVQTYHADYYGAMKGINAGVASDRLLAEWHLNDPFVAAGAKGQRFMMGERRVHIGGDFEEWLVNDLARATLERMRVRTELLHAFAEGLVIAGYDAEAKEYVLGRV